jgi:hypothetical protein
MSCRRHSCWKCREDIDHRNPGINIGDWVVCRSCYAVYEGSRAQYSRGAEDWRDGCWLALRNGEVEVCKWDGKVEKVEFEIWLKKHVRELETEVHGLE